MTLSEYKDLADTLPPIQPLGVCCSQTVTDTVYIEPLEGRNTLEVDRTCVVECGECGRQYVSRWD